MKLLLFYKILFIIKLDHRAVITYPLSLKKKYINNFLYLFIKFKK